jgi:phosphate transport system permease protein
MNRGLTFQRRVKDRVMRSLCVGATLAALVPLASLVLYVAFQGIHRLDWQFFFHLPLPVGMAGGGMANAIAGTFIMVLIGCCVGIPVGIMAAIYLAEFGGEGGRLAWGVRFTADVLSGVPSIVTGIFAYELVVRPTGGFSALAGGVALGFMMVPIVTRSTEEMLRMIPSSLREAALALGIPQWKTTLQVVLKSAQGGILTGVLLAGTRVAGETAPLLFTAMNNQFWPAGLNQPTASMTVQIYTFAISPFEDWHRQAWTGALVLLLMVLAASGLARLIFKGPTHLA